jgi:hypothetical protein
MKSLDKGSLLCLVSNAPEFQCFLTVANKDEKLLGQSKDFSLVDVVVADGNDSAQVYLLELLANNRCISDSLLLVEFRGILLAAYKSILENLQIRSRHPYLPFSNLLCPQSFERQVYSPRNRTMAVQPPLYALTENFQYDLSPLRKDGTSTAPLLLPVYAAPDDSVALLAKLEEETTLDSGQCKSLIAALTQELVLIQGYFSK